MSALDLYDKDGNKITQEEYWKLLEDRDYKRVAKDTLPNGRWVSTVWLGMNHQWGDGPPLIFETMIFRSENDMMDIYCERHATVEDALAGHAFAVLVAMDDEWTGYVDE